MTDDHWTISLAEARERLIAKDVEIERLTVLLREGIEVTMPYGDDGTVAYWRAKARRALEKKP